MNKQEFLDELRGKLSTIPQDDIDERITFYSEMINDRIEEGLSEEEAIAEIDPVNEIVSQIITEAPLVKLVKEKIHSKRKPGIWEIILLILGSPIWLSLLLAVSAIILSLYMILWSVLVSLWAVAVSVCFASLCGVTAGSVFVFTGNSFAGMTVIGSGIFCAGITVFLYCLCKTATRAIISLTKSSSRTMKKRFFNVEAI